MSVNTNPIVFTNIAIERVSIDNPAIQPGPYPNRGKESIELNGSPVSNRLTELFIGKVIKATHVFWKPKHLETSEVTPKAFHKAIGMALRDFEEEMAALGYDKATRSRRQSLEKAIEVLNGAMQNQKILAMYRGLLLKS